MQCLAVMSGGAANDRSPDVEEADTLGPLPPLRGGGGGGGVGGGGEAPRTLKLSESMRGAVGMAFGNSPQNSRRLALSLDGRESVISNYKLYEPKIVTFMRNGDKFFNGVKINVSQKNFRTWDVLLSELSRTMDLPSGVRQIFTPEGGHRVTNLSQLEPQRTYVCASNEPFKKIDYSKTKTPIAFRTVAKLRPSKSLFEAVNERNSLNESLNASMQSITGEPGFLSRSRRRSRRLSSLELSFETLEEEIPTKPQRKIANVTSPCSPVFSPTSVKPAMVMVIRNGPPPRKSANVFLNKNTITSWEQVRCLISDSLCSTNGCLRLYKPDGTEVRSLSQLWKAGSILIAAGAEGFNVGEFMMGTIGNTILQTPTAMNATSQGEQLSPLSPAIVSSRSSMVSSEIGHKEERKTVRESKTSRLELQGERSNATVASPKSSGDTAVGTITRERMRSLAHFPERSHRKSVEAFTAPLHENSADISHVAIENRMKRQSSSEFEVVTTEATKSPSRLQKLRPPELVIKSPSENLTASVLEQKSLPLTPKPPSGSPSMPNSARKRRSLVLSHREGDSTPTLSSKSASWEQHFVNIPEMKRISKLSRNDVSCAADTSEHTTKAKERHRGEGDESIHDKEKLTVQAEEVALAIGCGADQTPNKEPPLSAETADDAQVCVTARSEVKSNHDSPLDANEETSLPSPHANNMTSTPVHSSVQQDGPQSQRNGLDSSSPPPLPLFEIGDQDSVSSNSHSDIEAASHYPQSGSSVHLDDDAPMTLASLTEKHWPFVRHDSSSSLESEAYRSDTPSSCSSLVPGISASMRLYASNLIRSYTPQSEISLSGAHQSLVDMLVPRLILGSEQGSLYSPSSTSLAALSQTERRTIGIQTNYSDNELSTTFDTEVNLSADCHEISNNELLASTGSQTNELGTSTDSSTQANNRTKDNYEVGMIVAEGAFAVVKECQLKRTHADYMLKVINKAKVFGQNDLIESELGIAKLLRHENILQVVDDWETSDDICLVMELIQGGDLFDAVLSCQHFSELDTAKVMWELGLAMVYLHAHRITHRDIKPENIFLHLTPAGDDWSVKLGGFSLATQVFEPLSLVCSTQHYVAPEMIQETGYGTKVDVWSAGVIAYVLLSGTMPFGRKSRSSLLARVDKQLSFPSTFWSTVSDDAKDFTRRLLVVAPQQRYSSSQMLQHSWLKDRYMLRHTKESKRLSLALLEHLANKNSISSVFTVTSLDKRKALMKQASKKSLKPDS